MANKSGLSYNTIDRPYDVQLNREGEATDSDSTVPGSVFDNEVGGVAGGGVSGGGSDAEDTAPEIPGALDNLWINSWIKSKNYSPKTKGFLIDGMAGYIECMKLYVGGGGMVGGKLDIPDETTANSFHVDENGSMWLGSNVAVGYAGANAYILNDGSAKFKDVILSDNVTLTDLKTGSEIAIQGWQTDIVFSSTNSNTVSWTAGTISLMDTTTYAIDAGSIGSMSALTYIYFSTATPTELVTSTSAADAVGSGKILMGVAENVDSDSTTSISCTTGNVDALSETSIVFTETVAGEISTYSLSDSGWAKVGNTLTGININSMTALSSTRIAVYETTGTDELRTYDFDGTDWTQTGNAFNIGILGLDGRITKISSSRIAFLETGSSSPQGITTFNFDGTDWTKIGNSGPANVYGHDIAGLSSTRVCIVDKAGTDHLITYDFDGTDWTQTGNETVFPGTVYAMSMAPLSASRVAIATNESVTDSISAYDFDGTDWTLTGNEFTISTATLPTIGKLSSSKVIYFDSTNKELRVYGFDGTDWSLDGNAIFQIFGGTGGGVWGVNNIADGIVTSDKIAANTITANNIAADAITSNEIAANTITANQIAASTITSSRMSVNQLSAISADMGAITAGTMTVDSSGYIRGGQTDFATGTGWFVGHSGDNYKLSIGDSSNYITWDGSYLRISGNLDLTSIFNNIVYAVADLPVPPSTEGFNSPTAYE